jgi:Tfp pilus assembly protein PilW
MNDIKKLDENIRQAVDLISAVLRRTAYKRLDKSRHKSLYMTSKQGVAA